MDRFAAPSPGGWSWPSRAVLVGVAAFLTGLAAGTLIPDQGPVHDCAVARPNADVGSPAQPGGVAVTPGPTGTKNGAPVGFAQSKEGLVAAAAAFIATGQRLLDMDPLAAEEAIRGDVGGRHGRRAGD